MPSVPSDKYKKFNECFNTDQDYIPQVALLTDMLNEKNLPLY